MSEVQKFTLSDRPQWRGVKLLKWLALGTFLFGFLAFTCAILLSYLDSFALHGNVEDVSAIFNISTLLDELAWVAVGLGFYAAVLWFLSAILDKVDQLVWLAASDEDRTENIQKRKKKNAKNN